MKRNQIIGISLAVIAITASIIIGAFVFDTNTTTRISTSPEEKRPFYQPENYFIFKSYTHAGAATYETHALSFELGIDGVNTTIDVVFEYSGYLDSRDVSEVSESTFKDYPVGNYKILNKNDLLAMQNFLLTTGAYVTGGEFTFSSLQYFLFELLGVWTAPSSALDQPVSWDDFIGVAFAMLYGPQFITGNDYFGISRYERLDGEFITYFGTYSTVHYFIFEYQLDGTMTRIDVTYTENGNLYVKRERTVDVVQESSFSEYDVLTSKIVDPDMLDVTIWRVTSDGVLYFDNFDGDLKVITGNAEISWEDLVGHVITT